MAKPIKGSNGNDVLDGRGASKVMAGGRGDDVYVFDDSGDSAVENKKGGHDTVHSEVDYVLESWIEDALALGDDDIQLSGNDLGNSLVGNDGANVLLGGGGDDTLIGGAGGDILDGGYGIDTVAYSGSVNDFIFARKDDNLLVTNANGETDFLTGVEFVLFDEGPIPAEELGHAPEPPDTPLVAQDDAADVSEDSHVTFNVLTNDTGVGLVLLAVSETGNGSVEFDADGTITFVPDPNFHGDVALTYTVADLHGETTDARIIIEVLPVNDAPVAADDQYNIDPGVLADGSITVLANDHDPDGDIISVVAFSGPSDMGGSVVMNTDGTFDYTPTTGFEGNDSFSYTAIDEHGLESEAHVLLHVHADGDDPHEPPVGGDVPYYVDGILQNGWEPQEGPTVITFAFPSDVPNYYPANHHTHDGFMAFSDQHAEMTRLALAEISEFANIQFVEVSSPKDADLTFAFSDLGGWNGLTSPALDGTGNSYNDVWLTNEYFSRGLEQGSEAYKVLIHEIGHTLGLSHVDNTLIDAEENDRAHTVMSANEANYLGFEPSEMMLFDKAAIQHLYGANTTHADGDDTYDIADVHNQLASIWDAGGHDTLDLSDAENAVSLNLNAGTFSSTMANGAKNLSIAHGTTIENAIGSDYNDQIVGNEVSNTLTGGAGSDSFGFGELWGQDNITDFESGTDQLVFNADISFEDLLISSSQDGTLIQHGENSVFLHGTTEVDEDDLLFGIGV